MLSPFYTFNTSPADTAPRGFSFSSTSALAGDCVKTLGSAFDTATPIFAYIMLSKRIIYCFGRLHGRPSFSGLGKVLLKMVDKLVI